MGAMILTNPRSTQFTDQGGTAQMLLDCLPGNGMTTVVGAQVLPTPGTNAFQPGSISVRIGGMAIGITGAAAGPDNILGFSFTIGANASETPGDVNTATISVNDTANNTFVFLVHYYRRRNTTTTAPPTTTAPFSSRPYA